MGLDKLLAFKIKSQINDIVNQMVVIDDSTPANDKAYSSSKVQALVEGISSEGVADGTMGVVKLQAGLRINESINLFNKETATEGKSINYSTGAVIDSASDSLSDFIPVVPLMPYKKTSNTRFVWFTSEKVFISGVGAATSMTAPENAAYIRIVVLTASIGAEMFAYGWQDITTYQPYNIYKIKTTSLEKLSLVAEETKTRNLISYTECDFGAKYSLTDGTRTTGDFAWTGKISVIPAHYYTFRKGDNVGTSWVFFNASDGFISAISGVKIAVAPANASYVRVKINSMSDLLKVTILEGTNRVDYDMPTHQITVKPLNINKYYRSKWYGKRWWVMGDSISTGDGVEGAYAIKPYHWLLQEERGIIVHSIATSGKTLTGTSADDCVMQVTNGKMPETGNAPNVITIFAGTNDYGYNYPMGTDTDTTTGTFKGGLNKLFTDLQTRFPKTSIGVITPLPRSTDTANGTGLKLVDYVNAIKSRAAAYNIPVLDLYTNGGINFTNAAVNTALSVGGDGLHPNNDGHFILKGRIGDFLESL